MVTLFKVITGMNEYFLLSVIHSVKNIYAPYMEYHFHTASPKLTYITCSCFNNFFFATL